MTPVSRKGTSPGRMLAGERPSRSGIWGVSHWWGLYFWKPISFEFRRFPADVIHHAVWLQFRLGFSFRDVEERCRLSRLRLSETGRAGDVSTWFGCPDRPLEQLTWQHRQGRPFAHSGRFASNLVRRNPFARENHAKFGRRRRRSSPG